MKEEQYDLIFIILVMPALFGMAIDNIVPVIISIVLITIFLIIKFIKSN